MAVVIDGTTGISTPAETVLGNLSYTGTLTGNGGIVNLGSGQVYKDASGNVGIGGAPSAWGSGFKALQLGARSSVHSASDSSMRLAYNAYWDGTGYKRITAGSASYWLADTDGSFGWFQAGSSTAGSTVTATQALTLDSSGNLLVGTTTPNFANINSLALSVSGGGSLVVNHNSSATSGTSFANFGYNATGIGSITQNGTTGVSYNTSSDYRLKEAIAPMTGALAKVLALIPVTYKWKADGSDGQGFIAHELAEVVPECVTGEKDAVDADGKPVYQGIDVSFLVATLTAAIQELKAVVDEQSILIASQAARITALEGTAA